MLSSFCDSVDAKNSITNLFIRADSWKTSSITFRSDGNEFSLAINYSMALQLKNANEWSKQNLLKYQTVVHSSASFSVTTNLLNVNDNLSPFHRNVSQVFELYFLVNKLPTKFLLQLVGSYKIIIERLSKTNKRCHRILESSSNVKHFVVSMIQKTIQMIRGT